MTFSRGQGFVIGRIDSEAQLMTEIGEYFKIFRISPKRGLTHKDPKIFVLELFFQNF